MIYLGPAIILGDVTTSIALDLFSRQGIRCRFERAPGTSCVLIPDLDVSHDPSWITTTGPAGRVIDATLITAALDAFQVRFAPELRLLRTSGIPFDLRFVAVHNPSLNRG